MGLRGVRFGKRSRKSYSGFRTRRKVKVDIDFMDLNFHKSRERGRFWKIEALKFSQVPGTRKVPKTKLNQFLMSFHSGGKLFQKEIFILFEIFCAFKFYLSFRPLNATKARKER